MFANDRKNQNISRLEQESHVPAPAGALCGRIFAHGSPAETHG